jgi:GNAT superfamily N-acetyltransferase
MFASVALAARIEHAEARLTASMVRFMLAEAPGSDVLLLETLGQGVAAYAGPSSPMNKLIGVGFGPLPSDDRLRDIEARFRERAAPLQAEVATLADPALAEQLTRSGYVLRNFENVSGRTIVEGDRHPPAQTELRIELLTTEHADAWVDVAITSFQHADGQGVAAEELPSRALLEASLGPWARSPGFVRYCAWLDDRLAGVATLRIDEGMAQLCGAATLPAFRRRGIQRALLERRLQDAARAGCDLAVVTTQPGSKSKQNVARQGFALLYARAILIRDPT